MSTVRAPSRVGPAPSPAPRRVRPTAAPRPKRLPRGELRLIDPAALPRPRRGARLAGSFTVVLVILALFGLAVFHTVLVQGQQRLDQLDGSVVAQEDRYERLRLQVAELESPARVVQEASTRLGMVPPGGVTYLSPTGPVSSPGDGTGATEPEEGSTPAPGRGWAAVKPYLGGAP